MPNRKDIRHYLTADAVVLLLILAISSGIKNLYCYVELSIDFNLLLAHVVTTIGISAIFTFMTYKSRRRIWFAAWYVLQTIYLFINVNYFQFVGTILHLNSAIALFPEISMLARNLAVPLDRGDLLFVADFPLFLYMFIHHGKFSIRPQLFKTIIRTSVVVTALAMVLLEILPVRFETDSMARIDHADIVSRYGFLGHNLSDLLELFTDDRRSENIVYGRRITSREFSDRRANIILIQVESLDANIVNYRYLGEYVTPFFHRLTTQSLYFPYTLCYRKTGGTSDCEIAVNNGIEPLVDFPLIMDERYTYPNSVVKELKKSGYHAEAFHGVGGWFYKRRFAYQAMGYDNFFDPAAMKLHQKKWGVPDKDLLDYVGKHLEDRKTPFLVSIITLSSHEPFNLEHFDRDPRFDKVEPQLTGNYFASIAYTDRVVGEFVAKMQQEHPDTFIFLYGDHTPYVINSGPFRRSILTDGEEMEMVPLFIITPDRRTHNEHEAVASYLDIAPTILHASGIPYSYRSLGANLLDPASLGQPVMYHGRLCDRADLFRQMSEKYRDK